MGDGYPRYETGAPPAMPVRAVTASGMRETQEATRPRFGGSNAAHDRNPSWYFNIKANPEVMLTLRGGHQGNYFANEVPQGEKRERLWKVACEMYPGFADYQTRADRLIPLIHCTPLVR